MAEDTMQELELDYANKRLRLRGSDIIQVVVAIFFGIAIALFGYVLYEHKQDSAKRDDKFISAIDKMTASSDRNGVTLREMVCVSSLEQSKRSAELTGVSTICKRLANAQ